MKVLILGATGSIGRHLVPQALALGHEVTVLGSISRADAAAFVLAQLRSDTYLRQTPPVGYEYRYPRPETLPGAPGPKRPVVEIDCRVDEAANPGWFRG